MKHKLLYSAIGMLLTAAAVTGFITNSAISQVNDLMQANIEALANDETILDKPNWTVYNTFYGWDCTPDGESKCPH